MLGAAGRHHDLPGLVVGIGDPDPAGRRPQVAVEIIDGEDSHVNGCGVLGEGLRRWSGRDEQRERRQRSIKFVSHDPNHRERVLTISRKFS